MHSEAVENDSRNGSNYAWSWLRISHALASLGVYSMASKLYVVDLRCVPSTKCIHGVTTSERSKRMLQKLLMISRLPCLHFPLFISVRLMHLGLVLPVSESSFMIGRPQKYVMDDPLNMRPARAWDNNPFPQSSNLRTV